MCLNDYINIQKFFDEKSISWHFSEKDSRNAIKLVSMLTYENPEIILDVGCGTGELYPFLRKRHKETKIIGMDLSLKMLKKIHFNYDCIFQGNAEKLPIQNDSVDIVLNYCVFPHFIDKIQAIKEAFRVLKKNGHYYIIHPDGRKKTDEKHRNQKFTVVSHLLPRNDEFYESLSSTGFWIFKHIDQDVLLFCSEK